jgi:RNA polymerase sigma factor (sigma-70 family)
MTELLSGIEAPSDAELIARVRSGEHTTYAELYSRHVEAARRLARQLTRGGPDADDLVSEAFAKTLQALQGGGGPDIAFRAYLLTCVRRLHVDRVRAATRVQPAEDMSRYDPGVAFTDPAVASFESGAAAQAFSSLPERWQLVLWHLEVEGQKPAEVAPLLGLTPNSVSALAYRAREGLRQAYLTMHLAGSPTDDCRWVNEHLGGHVRKGLSRRDTTKVETHLEGCRRCTAMYLELREVNSNLAGIIGPLLLGGAAAGYASAAGTAGLTGVSAVIGRIRDTLGVNAGGGAATSGSGGVLSGGGLLSGGLTGGALTTGGLVTIGGVAAAGVAVAATAAVMLGGGATSEATAETDTAIAGVETQSPRPGAGRTALSPVATSTVAPTATDPAGLLVPSAPTAGTSAPAGAGSEAPQAQASGGAAGSGAPATLEARAPGDQVAGSTAESPAAPPREKSLDQPAKTPAASPERSQLPDPPASPRPAVDPAPADDPAPAPPVVRDTPSPTTPPGGSGGSGGGSGGGGTGNSGGDTGPGKGGGNPGKGGGSGGGNPGRGVGTDGNNGHGKGNR